MTDAQKQSLIRHLAGVMEWTCQPSCPVDGYSSTSFLDEYGHERRLDPTSWLDAGMVWERAREMGVYVTLHGNPKEGWKAYYPIDLHRSLTLERADADSGPLALCLAVARATGWEEPCE